MPEPELRIQLTLHLQAAGNPVHGLVEDSSGRQRAFWGWLEFMETVRRLADDAPLTPPSNGSTAIVRKRTHGPTPLIYTSENPN